jgi:nitrite reductase/ring-hydroxylating ferredoxin subunit
MSNLSESIVFNNTEVFVEGWYWALPSKELKRGKVAGLEILGKNLAAYRGENGRVTIIDAYCPHMGAHFKEGRVDGNSIRCGFHDWKFDPSGECVDIPCQKYRDRTAAIPPIQTYPVREAYGLIWIFTGPKDQAEFKPLPEFPKIAIDSEMEVIVGPRTFRNCRPEVVMLNAIDAHHFNSVHPEAALLAGGLDLRAVALSPHQIRISNISPPPHEGWIGRVLRPFYKSVMTYHLEYWYASCATVSLGPDFLNLNLLFPHRPTMKGGTEGIMIYVAPRPQVMFGKIIAKAVAWLTGVAGGYFEKGDVEIFNSIRFSMRAPVKADHPIIEFIRHAERQKTAALPWGESVDHIKRLRRIVPEGEEIQGLVKTASAQQGPSA